MRKAIKNRVMFSLALPGDLLKRADDWRYKNHIPSRAEAIRQLMELGLKAGGRREGTKQ